MIKVNCRKDAGEINEAIRYGLAVTLEDTEHALVPISDLPGSSRPAGRACTGARGHRVNTGISALLPIADVGTEKIGMSSASVWQFEQASP